VNRGPQSLECLRYVRSLGDSAITVFGNHDFHLLCVAEGVEATRKRDTLEGILDAPDRDELLDWLRARPLIHVEDGWALVHAGLLPQWSVARAKEILRTLDDADLGKTWQVVKDGREVMAIPVGAVLRSIMLNHWYHHRGQLSVYLRQVGALVPSIYGPSADENPFAMAQQQAAAV